MLRGVPGFYSYATFERLEGWRDMVLYEGRIAFKLQEKLYATLVNFILLSLWSIFLNPVSIIIYNVALLGFDTWQCQMTDKESCQHLKTGKGGRPLLIKKPC